MPKINFHIKKIKESSAEVFIPSEAKISKKMPVFYNPAMKMNRDITILLLNQFPPMKLCDSLAGTGIRAIRFAKELDYKSITVNDINKNAYHLIKKNMHYNKVRFKVNNKNANTVLLESTGFDYIDIDPFGSPNYFFDAAIKKLNRDGILAVTATDTSALCGTHIHACLRKYWATPKHGTIMKEIGLRILIRKIQLIGAQYEKALVPIFSYSDKHYFRVFLKCKKSRSEVKKIIECHKMFNDAGPLWLGNLWNDKLTKKIYDFAIKDDYFNSDKYLMKLLKTIKEESKIITIGFYDIHSICKKNKIKKIPKKELIVEKIKKSGYKVSETHFSPVGLRSDIGEKRLIKILKNITV